MIYCDTCVLIYLVERHPQWHGAVSALMAARVDAEFAVSPLVRLECLVRPVARGDDELARRYEDALAQFRWLPITDKAFDRALRLRAAHGLRTPDALHLATALVSGCDEFWTNDRRLDRAADALTVTVPRDEEVPGAPETGTTGLVMGVRTSPPAHEGT
ncbi:MAG: type II toxin-antitoxin system VapC family toxin [Bifidobacteriaceae bacterium]|nr:type II toxin-antitoxin system VapC family toxin [Bifidobacteriaceae bacterium]